MVRKLRSLEKVEWYNPLKDANPKPYLTDEPWPDDPRDPSWDKALSVLNRFYCEDRNNGQEDVSNIQNYLDHPESYLIIWGEVGIGKSWFARYELLAGEASMTAKPYHAGIIEMLSSRGTEFGIYAQLGHILEGYFKRFCGSARKALEEYIAFDIATLHGKPKSELSDAEIEDVKMQVRQTLELRHQPSHEATLGYIGQLLATLQYLDRDEPLVLLIDNIDKTRDEEQERLVKLAARLLRHPMIRLVIPLRKSSRLLFDRFSVLKEFTYREMELHPLNLREMLRLRFGRSRDGVSLHGGPAILDQLDSRRYTFPQLFAALFGQDEASISEAGHLVLAMAGSNAREALALTRSLLYSDQLKGLAHIDQGEYTVAALMLSDTSQPSTSCVINLFNNEEPNVPYNALIRFRVLEYFWNAQNATTSDESFKHYFRSLGYDLDRVKRVIELFAMIQLLVSMRGLSPEDISATPFDKIGGLEITRSGDRFQDLLKKMWYFVSVKRGVYLPETIIFQDSEGVEYCTHRDFIEWMKSQETKERNQIRQYTSQMGRVRRDWQMKSPHKLASQALKVSKGEGD